MYSAAYGIPGGEARLSGYGFSGTPSAMFDGTLSYIGGLSGGSLFAVYDPLVAARLAVASPLTLAANYVATGTDLSITATVTVDQSIAPGSRRVTVVVTEDGVHGQVNLARLLLTPEPFTLTTAGESVTVVRTCPLDPAWNLDDLRPVVLVENVAGGVLQAAYAAADYAGTVVVDASPALLDAPWRLQGPQGYDLTSSGSTSLPVFATGTYTLTWSEVPGWDTPTPSVISGTLTDGGLLTLAGVYGGGPFVTGPAGPLADSGPAAGLALVDFDDDGDLDVFLARPGAANRLLRQDPGLSFTDIAAGELAAAAATVGGAWSDYDHDGDQDVFLVRDGVAGVLLQQTTPGSFAPASALGLTASGHGRAAGWVDYDRDNLLDLYVVQHNQANQLYRCVYQTAEITVFGAQGGLVADSGPGTAAPWCDYDLDGDDDLFLVNAFAPNLLLRNHHGVLFENATVGLLGEVAGGAGAAWGDYDGDGLPDLLVANDGGPARLFRNTGGDFTLVQDASLGQPSPTRAALWLDHDLDGDLDVYLCRDDVPDILLRQDAGVFTPVPIGLVESQGPSTAAACGDVDGDGDLDIYLARNGTANVLLLNQTPAGHWLQVRLRTGAGNADAIGARVRVVTDGRAQVREVRAGGASLGQDPLTVHFGLGNAARVDSLFVRWPDDSVLAWSDLAVDRRLDITEGDDPPVSAPDVVPRTTALAPPYPNPFNPRTTLRFTLASDGPVRLEIFDLAGRRVRTLVAESRETGEHAVAWAGDGDDGERLPSGAYLARLRTPGRVEVQKLLLAK